jgi:hypothetical protein
MRLRGVIGVMVVLGSMAALSRAEAKPKLAVLGVEAVDDGDAKSVEKTTSLAKALTEGLRAGARKSQQKFDAAPNGNKELSELKLLSDCMDENKDCMAQIGKDVGADRVLYGHIQRSGSGYVVVLQLFNVQTKAIEGRARSFDVGPDQATTEGMKKLGGTSFGDLTGTGQKGSIVLTANVETGVVYVDGNASTAITNGTATIPDLDEGTYHVAIESDGYKRFEVDVPVKLGEPSQVPVNLEKELISKKPDKGTARPGGTSRAIFWSGVVATGLGVTTFAITGIKVTDYENEKIDAIKASMGTITAGSNADACAEAAAKHYAPVTNPCSSGKTMATVTNVAIGATMVLALVTGYFYYKGYMAAPKSDGREHASRSKHHLASTVIVTPEIYSSGVGLGAVIQF